MTKCDLCDSVATRDCDRCGHVRFCDACHRTDIPECACRECILSSRDCNYCADQWRSDNDEPLALVCGQCRRGYCHECVVHTDGRVHCPQCFEQLGSRLDPPIEEIDEQMTKINAIAELSTPVDDATEIEKSMAEIELIEERASPVDLKPARRRRRNIKPEPELRPDNVCDMETEPPLVMTTITADRILLGQVRNRLRQKYDIDADPFLDAIYNNRAAIIGSFPLEIIHAESYADSDLDICATETAATHIRETLPVRYVCTHSARKYNSLANYSWIRHVETWEVPGARIQFIIMDADSISKYLAIADMTVVQNSFNGRAFHIADERTLTKCGTVLVDTVTARIGKYYRRGYKLLIPLTHEVASRVLTE